MFVMNPTAPKQEIEFLWRRLTEEFQSWVVGIPVFFALGVVLLLALFRTERRWSLLGIHLAVVAAIAAVYVPLALFFKPMLSWWVVLLPMLLVGLFYVGLMYLKDAQTVHPLWAMFLGLCRCTVYAILATVFLLPGCQTFDKNEYHPKVLVLLDVSNSMATIDDVPQAGQDPTLLESRRDKVLKFLTEKSGPDQDSFLTRVLKKSALEIHRFGGKVDDQNLLRFNINEDVILVDKMDAFLKPQVDQYTMPADLSDEKKTAWNAKIAELVDTLTSSTNVPGAALEVTKNQGNNFLQAIIIISDGQSNVGNTQESVNQFLARVNNPLRKVSVFTVGVGEYRQPASIRLEDLLLPDEATPDDKFPVRVRITATGLLDESVDCVLEMQRFKNAGGQEVADPVYVLPLAPQPMKKIVLEASGDSQKGQTEFEIDLQNITGFKLPSTKPETDEQKKKEAETLSRLEGRWKFTAKVRRHPREAFKEEWHVSKPVGEVQVQRKKLRVLLFASGPSREYQFVRTLFHREAEANRLELSVFLQQTAKEDNVDQDVKKERLLSEFPKYLGELKKDTKDGNAEKYLNLAEYDVIIAMDPDWSQLKLEQLKMVQDWVGAHAGGIIFVAGPVHSYFLARPAGMDISALQSIYPVILEDSRLIGTGMLHDASRPYHLNFSGYAKDFDFLKLDEKGKEPTAGWDHFFWGGPEKKPEPGKDIKPQRGIYNYYPVKSLRGGSQVVASFPPPAPRIDENKEEMPFMVSMKYGSGKSFFIGSAETYQLRAYNTLFHDRFWIKLARNVSAGNTPQKRYGQLVLPPTASVGNLSFEAQLKGRDLMPLSRDLLPSGELVRLDALNDDERKPIKFDMRPRNMEGEWQGWFMGNLKLDQPGQYELRLPIPGVGETLTKKFTVRRPNPEADNLRTNFAALYQMATSATPVLNRLDLETRRDIERYLQVPSGELPKDDGGKEEGPKLYFSLYNADQISRCLFKLDPKTEDIKGALVDLWDQGAKTGYEVQVFWLAVLTPLFIGLLGAGIMLAMGQWVNGPAFFGAGVVLSLLAILFYWTPLGDLYLYVLIGGLFAILAGGGLLILLYLREYFMAFVAFGLFGLLAAGAFVLFANEVSVGQVLGTSLPVDFSYVLVTIVSLLAIEWLTRKLLKLA